jgi:hypothetical protein
MKLALLIITYNRVEDAKIQMELVRKLWQEKSGLKDITIFHCFNGKRKWYAKKYLEDVLIHCKNPGHYDGAGLMYDTGIKRILKYKKKFNYIIAGSSDRWLIKPKIVEKTLFNMKNSNSSLLSAKWFYTKGFSTELFIITPQLAKKVFPLNIKEYRKKHKIYSAISKVTNLPILERCFAQKVSDVLDMSWKDFEKSKSIYFFPDKSNRHWFNSRYDPRIGYVSLHDPKLKKEILLKSKLSWIGPTTKKLTNSKDFNYYVCGSFRRKDTWIEQLQVRTN